MTWNKRSVPLICLTTSSLPAQNFASVTRRVSDDERSVLTGTRVSEERAATQSMAQKASRSKAEVCKTPVPQFKSGCRLQKNRVHQDSVFLWRRHPDLNWGIGVSQTSALLLLVFCAIDCVAARSSDTRVPVCTLRSSSLTRLVTDAKSCAGKNAW